MEKNTARWKAKPYLLTAAAAIIVDGFVLNSVIVSLVLLLALPFLLIRALWAVKRPPVLKKRLLGAGVLLMAIIICLGAIQLNAAAGRAGAESIIAACEKFRTDHGRYPDKLEDLTPAYLERIPRPNYTILLNRYFYLARPDRHWIFFAIMPPFGRAVYSLEEKEWSYPD
ncbi:MAG: hypothetical protein V1816_09625 [Pseudomonadota bacterium]